MAFKGKDIGDTKEPEVFEREPTYYDQLDEAGRVLKIWELPIGTVLQIRFRGFIFPMRRHWMETPKGKKFPVTCRRFDPGTEEFVKKHKFDCLACYCGEKQKGGSRAPKAYMINLINRHLQEQGYDNPVQMVMLGNNLQLDIRKAIEAWKIKPTDEDRGFDMTFTVSKGESGPNIGLTPVVSPDGHERNLNPQERSYELIDLEAVYTSLLPNRSDEVVSFFYNGYITLDEATEIISQSVAMGLVSEEDALKTSKAINTINSKRYGGGSTHELPTEAKPPESRIPLPQPGQVRTQPVPQPQPVPASIPLPQAPVPVQSVPQQRPGGLIPPPPPRRVL